MTTDERAPVLSRAALAAIGAAGVALVLAIVTVVVVLGRSPEAPRGRALLEADADASALRAMFARNAVTEVTGGLAPVDPAAIGLARGDVLTTLGGRPLHTVGDLQIAMRAAIRGGAIAFVFEILRGGQPQVVRIAARGELEQPPDVSGPIAPALSGDPDLQEILNGVTKIDDEHVTVTRATVDKVLSNPMQVAAGARVVPSIKDGKPNGFKLYAIRPTSLYAALGFENGDTITSVNDEELTSIDKALEIYTALRDADAVFLELLRRGQPVVLTITIVP